ncbi:MAG: excinuclease ABC subunit UvrC [Clostridia bacterium]|nr:excinuclease ABC subunit UvrC [Clostridia bacterium]
MEIKDQLREKANALPLRPGVYIMKNGEGRVIYVGKSKALRNRVSQYFQSGGGHNEKTRRMVASVRSFDYVLTNSEIEALALENKLIKLHSPRYNIRLKDGKSYPYIRISPEKKGEWPRVTVTRSRKKDGARYFGPYSGIKTPYDILETLKRVFGLPSCKHSFPEEAGKVRPCIYMQMGQCIAPCTGAVSKEDYTAMIDGISSFLKGDMGTVKRELKEEMLAASEELRFERAALLRDRLKALERLYDKQQVVGAPGDEFDVVSLYEDEECACLCVLYVRDGMIFDSEYLPVGGETILDGDAVCAMLCELYVRKDYLPSEICIGYPLTEEERETLEGYLCSLSHRVKVRLPERGTKKQLCDLARDNAAQHAKRYEKEEKKEQRGLVRLAALLGLEVFPEHIEAIDISNYGNEEITAGLVCFENGKARKSGYRLYKMKDQKRQDDYGAMRSALERRLAHADDQPLPDLLLLDGGKGHVGVVRALFEERGVELPVFGMVKDEFHKTRALTDGENELSIAGDQAAYLLVYKIQEEVHRFAFGATNTAKRKKLKKSVLEEIKGIGKEKARMLLTLEGGLAGVKKASVSELEMIKGISHRDALQVYAHFHPEEQGNGREN